MTNPKDEPPMPDKQGGEAYINGLSAEQAYAIREQRFYEYDAGIGNLPVWNERREKRWRGHITPVNGIGPGSNWK